MYFIEIEEDILNEIIFKLREKDLIQLSNELIDSIDMDFEPEKYVEESEDYETDIEEDVSYSIDDEGLYYLD